MGDDLKPQKPEVHPFSSLLRLNVEWVTFFFPPEGTDLFLPAMVSPWSGFAEALSIIQQPLPHRGQPAESRSREKYLGCSWGPADRRAGPSDLHLRAGVQNASDFPCLWHLRISSMSQFSVLWVCYIWFLLFWSKTIIWKLPLAFSPSFFFLFVLLLLLLFFFFFFLPC